MFSTSLKALSTPQSANDKLKKFLHRAKVEFDVKIFHGTFSVLVRNLYSLFCVFWFSLPGIDWQKYSDGIAMILFQGDVDYAKGHGCAKLGKEVLWSFENYLPLNFSFLRQNPSGN